MQQQAIEIPDGMTLGDVWRTVRTERANAARTAQHLSIEIMALERVEPSPARDAMLKTLRERRALYEALRVAYGQILPESADEAPTEAKIMDVLGMHNPDPVSLAEIVASTGVKKETARSALRRMIEDGLVTRVDPGGPTRSGTYALTDGA